MPDNYVPNNIFKAVQKMSDDELKPGHGGDGCAHSGNKMLAINPETDSAELVDFDPSLDENGQSIDIQVQGVLKPNAIQGKLERVQIIHNDGTKTDITDMCAQVNIKD